MRVIFAIPSLDGKIHTQCHQSLVTAYRLLDRKGIEHDEFCISGCPCLSTARNTLAAMFLADPEATDLFFIDSDVGFDAAAVLRILERPESIVAGIYPLKRDWQGFPVKLRTEDGVPLGRDGLLEGELLPAGFMRIKRGVFEILKMEYPELKYEDSVVEIIGEGRNFKEAYDFFGMGVLGRRFTTEDYAFCHRWRALDGTLWVDPNIEFTHMGTKGFSGNYHEYLLRCPGGAKDPNPEISRAMQIPGWMSPDELAWLAEEAKKHKCIVELGSHLGRSTRALADNTPGIVYAIDDWKGPRQFKDGSPNEQWVEVQTGLFKAFQQNLSEHIKSGKVITIQADHAEAMQYMQGVTPDMVFLDGDHDYGPVKRDIEKWREIMSPGGLLCGHDIDWQGVRQAVNEAAPEAVQVPNTLIWATFVEEVLV